MGDVLGLRMVWFFSLTWLKCLLLPTYLQGAMNVALCVLSAPSVPMRSHLRGSGSKGRQFKAAVRAHQAHIAAAGCLACPSYLPCLPALTPAMSF